MHSNKNSLASALTVACATSQYGVAALLMKFGARAVITLRDREDFFRIPKVWQWFLVPSLTSKLTSQTLKPDDYDLKTLQDRRELWSPHATQPLEASMAAMNNIWKLLLYGEQAVPRLLGTQHSFFEDHTNILPKLTLLDAAERLSNTASMELGSAPSGICIDEEDDGIEKQQEEELSKKAPRMNDFANWKDWWTAFHRHKALTEEWSKGCIQSRPAHQRQQSLDHLVEILTSIQLYYSGLATELRQRGAKTIHEIKSCLPALDRPKESVDQNKRRLSASYKSESNNNQWQEFQGRRPAKIRKHQSDALWDKLKTKMPTIKFTRERSRYTSSFEPVRLNHLYTRLVQAAWEGDCQTIRALTRREHAERGLDELLDASIEIADYTSDIGGGGQYSAMRLDILDLALQRGQYEAAVELAKSVKLQFVPPKERAKAEAAIEKPNVQMDLNDGERRYQPC